MQPLRLARSFLPERPPEMTANPVGTRGSLGSGETPDQDGGPESAARRRHSVYDCGRSGRRRPQMSPDIEHVRVARREALPHFRKEMRILNRRRQRPLARHPLASGGERKTGLPGASTKNTGDGARLDVNPRQAGGGMVDHGPIDCEYSI